MSEPQLCPAGRYGEEEEEVRTEKCSGSCQPGHFCPQGSTNSTSRPCPAGRFSPATGQRVLQDCILCPRGFYCTVGAIYAQPCPPNVFGNSTGLTSDVCSGPCPKGSFCVAQSDIPVVCSPGSYSAGQVSSCTDCPAGYSAAVPGADSCTMCSVGKYALRKRSIACDKCFQGAVEPCCSCCFAQQTFTP